MRFLTAAVAGGKRAALARACRKPLPHDWVLGSLWEVNAETPLAELYEDWEFPAKDTEFKLGGHASELGHIHIDFVRSAAGWEIDSIWMCR